MPRIEPTVMAESLAPTRGGRAWLNVRMTGLRARRIAIDLVHPIPRFEVAHTPANAKCVGSHRSLLRTTENLRERTFESGKIQNLRIAAKRLDGLRIPAGATFSFWRHVGRCSRGKGYVEGRQLQEGCLVPAVGGGICQLSNALYDVALQAGCEILERHPHTRIIPGSASARNVDATVAWNYIDLRWRPRHDSVLRVHLTGEELRVEIWSLVEVPIQVRPKLELRQLIDPTAHSCGTCGQDACHLFSKGVREAPSLVAVLVDEYWPEFDAYLQAELAPGAELFVPLDGAKRRRPGYAWTTAGYSTVREAWLATLIRSIVSRRLASQGAARQRARLNSFEHLSRSFARRLTPEVDHAIVSLDLLPFLWRDGHLGGRSFDVLMTRFPIAELQRRLDGAVDRHPERSLLADFRAPAGIEAAESEALAHARRVVTPHRGLMPNDLRRFLLNWHLPIATSWIPGERVVFPGPTVARKGAYEVREAVRALGLIVRPLGSELEGEAFWEGVRVERPEGGWLDGSALVVQPAVLEDRPRRLLQAIASGCPVICTEACGIAGLPGAIIVPEGDVEALTEAIRGVQETHPGRRPTSE